ncbi:MAG TPA: ATP-dependent DNA helicase RecG, partial [Aestuariivirgaceae bacterium]|nr:ATP-dependent DNA helicase RecG [Aestuariivirgaceae bacterium]
MRPDVLNPLFASASALRGIGPKVEKSLAKLVGRQSERGPAEARIIDLLFHLPTGLIDRSARPKLAAMPEDGIVTVEVTVGRHRPPGAGGRRPYRIECFDDTGSLLLVFFHPRSDYLLRALPEGARRFVSGSVEWYGGLPQMVHPDHIVAPEEFARLPLVEPVYPLTADLPARLLARSIEAALDLLPQLTEWHDPTLSSRRNWPSIAAALRAAHRPRGASDLAPEAGPRQRLAYDELLANQLALALTRRHMKRASGRRISGSGEMRGKLLAALPYALTGSQGAAIEEVLRDMAAPERMLRLLQGDVGSGKTIVALFALIAAVEAGAQGALMAPTDLLARQHHANLAPLAAAAGVEVDLLTGREKGNVRDQALARLASGKTGILIGTHALFQQGVEFADLALIVIDEQHRFGVHQRLALQAKSGGNPDLLVMTATPIPRTLALTVYGDMDVSLLTEKPAGRQPVDTRVLPAHRMPEVLAGLRRAIAGGARIYWVCPLVAESEAVDLAAAEARFADLDKAFPGKVGLVHGRMRGPAKDAVMQRFQTGEIKLLVATTVIEVGVDVPEATVMVIDNAERFGLAQLHQLRGRVGRGGGRSACLLLYRGRLGETAKNRLAILRETDDGFKIAEEDLRLRGSGELLGTRQSGMPTFRLADLAAHGELIAMARDDAQLVLARDPDLATPRGRALRLLLYL